MDLTWQAWTGYVAPALQVIYRIQYRRHSHYGNGTMWNSGPDAINPNVKKGYAEATLKGLQHNTFYMVCVLPLLWHQAKLYTGTCSPSAGPFRTKCAKPAAPYISKIVTGLDESEAPTTAMLSVKWEGPDEGQVNCDNILYYKLLYQRQGSGGWQKVMVSSNEVMHNISGLNFSTGYNIKVEVINNQNLVAQSAMLNVVTPARGEVVPLERSDSTIMVVCIITAFLIILGAIIAMLLYRRRRAKYDPVPPKESASPPDGAPVQLNSFVKVESKEGTPTGDSGVGVGGSSDISPSSAANSINDAVPSQLSEPEVDTIAVPSKPPRNIPPIQVDDLEEYIMTRRANDSEELRSEYKDIPEGFTATYAYGKKTENKHKNRFVNIIAYDHSRVILDKEAGDEDSDYINASYIDGYKEPQQYIAAQGCTKWTIQDMWRMLWQVDSHRIIMATNLVENGKRKCEKYWPDKLDEGKMYGNIQVKLVEVEETSDFIIRTFDITKNGETRNIKQFHFTSWPDHGVPTRAAPLIALRKKVRSFDNTHPGCIIVHCSAGVGRTGTFIALDYLLSQAAAEGQVDIYGLTRSMRKDRVNMIQTVEQYLFVYDALLEALFSAHTTIPCSEFASRFEELCKVDPESDTGKTALQLQFEKLESMSPEKKTCDYQSGILKENTQKNRCADILPADRHRPYLMTRVQGTNDYINAVFLDGHRSRNAYIITQMPMPHTVIDFWRMVYEHRCGSIVMLNAWNGDVKGYGQYWPEDETCECGPFVIDPVSVDSTNKDITVRELKLTYQPESTNFAPAKDKVQANGQVAAPSSGKVMTVNQFQLNCWPQETATPASKNILVALTELVEKSQLKTGNGPIVIHCHDGLRQSGLYATISCMWEKMKVEQEVDIFHTVKHLRYYRANIIQDLEQYKFCYEMVLAYLAEFDTYSNFR
ncbi:hypothetical protein NP493_311g02032 [Ridgeia piscesae]|uniref:protein-tyrosine-phosphatase n=1 Tax=Ridgeia piscesae TaxID=27915 RepID=A0AAD9L5F3_RIDPI|nr:hypothetical protein NP493_311g02032 [Ridgeia piscesae]